MGEIHICEFRFVIYTVKVAAKIIVLYHKHWYKISFSRYSGTTYDFTKFPLTSYYSLYKTNQLMYLTFFSIAFCFSVIRRNIFLFSKFEGWFQHLNMIVCFIYSPGLIKFGVYQLGTVPYKCTKLHWQRAVFFVIFCVRGFR